MPIPTTRLYGSSENGCTGHPRPLMTFMTFRSAGSPGPRSASGDATVVNAKGVLFDLDGVLVGSGELQLANFWCHNLEGVEVAHADADLVQLRILRISNI